MNPGIRARGGLFLVWLLCAGSALAAAPGIQRGQSLTAALEALREAGLELVFSSALVPAEARVAVEPGEGSSIEIARRILAAQGLTISAIRPGVFAVVRLPAAVAAAAGNPSTTTTDRASSVESGAGSDGEPLDFVEVYASRYRVTPAREGAPVDFEREQIDRLPALDADVLRVMRYLPGTSTNGVSARANVRGGRDDEVAVLFDGIPLFEPYHFKDYQALLGVLDPSAIERLDFFSGVFPVRYGDRLSGVLDIEPRHAQPVDHRELGLSMLYAHALSVGQRRWQDRPVSWLVSVRQSTAQLVARAAGRESIDPDFRDVLGRVEREVGDRTRVAAGFMLLDDELQLDLRDDSERTSTRYRDGTGWLSATHGLPGELEISARVSGTERDTARSGVLARRGSVSGELLDRRELSANTLRIEAQRGAAWLLGFETVHSDVRYDYGAAAQFEPAIAGLFGRPAFLQRQNSVEARGHAEALYGSHRFVPGPRWQLDLGLRLDQQDYRTTGAVPGDRRQGWQWSPRVAAEYRWNSRTVLRASAGRATQSQRPDELQVSDGEPLFHPVQTADQIVLALERQPGERFTLRAEAYRKWVRDPAPRYENLLDPLALLPELEPDRSRVAPDSATLYGVELSGRGQFSEIWSGWATYSWSEAVDRFGAQAVPRSWNHRHALSAGLAWSPNPWQLSANLNWHSGWRRSVLDPLRLPAQVPAAAAAQFVSRNSADWPAFLSVDLRATWLRPLQRGALRVYVDVNNATDRSNPCCESLSATSGLLERESRNWLRRHAVVGATWELP